MGYGENREQAISRLARALPEYFVAGIKTNLGLFRRILGEADFRSGKIDTGYLERLLAKPESPVAADKSDSAAIAAAVFTLLDSTSRVAGNDAGAKDAASSWKRAAKTEGLM